MQMIKKHLPKIGLLLLVLILVVNTSAATCNIIIITDPTGKDPNGAAGGSMSFAENMFQSTFIMSKEHHFTVLSGVKVTKPRLGAIVETIKRLNNGESASMPPVPLVLQESELCASPTIGAAVEDHSMYTW